jgi:CRP-like cAMP-binding protein
MPHQFWLIRAGQVALDMDVPGRRITVETLGRGDMVGLSWFLPPCQWQFGAIAIQPTEAFEFDAAGVLRCCDEDPALGYDLTRRVLAVVAHRLQATRAKLLDASAQPG